MIGKYFGEDSCTSQGLKFLLTLFGIGQNHTLGTKFLVGARWVNSSEFKELHFTGALDRSKGNVCREQAEAALESRGGRGWAEQGNVFCQLAY